MDRCLMNSTVRNERMLWKNALMKISGMSSALGQQAN